MSVGLPVCLSVFICTSAGLSVCLSVFICMSVGLSVCLLSTLQPMCAPCHISLNPLSSRMRRMRLRKKLQESSEQRGPEDVLAVMRAMSPLSPMLRREVGRPPYLMWGNVILSCTCVFICTLYCTCVFIYPLSCTCMYSSVYCHVHVCTHLYTILHMLCVHLYTILNISVSICTYIHCHVHVCIHLFTVNLATPDCTLFYSLFSHLKQQQKVVSAPHSTQRRDSKDNSKSVTFADQVAKAALLNKRSNSAIEIDIDAAINKKDQLPTNRGYKEVNIDKAMEDTTLSLEVNIDEAIQKRGPKSHKGIMKRH